jgi:hypothetical protein
MLEPVGDQVLVKLEPLPVASSVIQLVRRPEPPGREATVLCGSGEFQLGDRVVISMRQAIQVGDHYLLPIGGILARVG